MKEITDKKGVTWLQSTTDPNYGIKADLDQFPVQVLYGKYGDDVEGVMDDVLHHLDMEFSASNEIIYSDFLDKPNTSRLRADVANRLNPVEIKLLMSLCHKILPKSHKKDGYYDLETLIKKFPRIVNMVWDCMEADIVVWSYPETELDMEVQENMMKVLTE